MCRMPDELQTPAAEQLMKVLQQQLPFASASARRLAASPLLKQMLRTHALEPSPGTPFWNRVGQPIIQSWHPAYGGFISGVS